ncbi:MAG: 50S ribosomal protein L11 methyltransferase [Christensenellales bacterium]|jgi:ribosomal protein L11 methyltransferase|nr:50S ribosomal protein L11 methyltransferase [Clostridiales bacterium]
MDWIETSVTTTTGASDALSELLMRYGAKGTQILDRLDIPQKEDWTGFGEMYGEDMKAKMPEEATVKAWFKSPEDALQAQSAVQSLKNLAGFDAGSLAFSQTQVRDEDWAENWKQYYKPMRVGKRLIIRPMWEAYEQEPGDLVIDMDPGMAFGTGNHETTRLCMAMIEKHYHGGRALDIGTGSGILAITLAKLGAQNVTAVDIDPIAVSAARENVARNQLGETIRVLQGDLAKDVSGQHEFICANILADVIISLRDALPPLLAQDGLFLASGIIKDREQDVLRAYKEAGYVLIDRLAEGEWVALLFGKHHA